MKHLIICYFAFIAISSYSQNANNFEGKYYVRGFYIILDGMGGFKDSINPKTVVVVNYGNQIILRNFAGTDSVFANLTTNNFIVPFQTFGEGENIYSISGEGHFYNDSLFYNYLLGGNYDLSYKIFCQGPKVIASNIHGLEQNKELFLCYPNPANDILFIDNNSGKHIKLQISIMDIDGHFIYSKVVSELHNTINLTMIPSGVYFVQIITDQLMVNEKIIKL